VCGIINIRLASCFVIDLPRVRYDSLGYYTKVNGHWRESHLLLDAVFCNTTGIIGKPFEKDVVSKSAREGGKHNS
jgi:hypothetical protein